MRKVLDSRRKAGSTYDRMVLWYDRLSGILENRHRNFGIRTLNPRSGESVLEIGCGPGRALVSLAEMVGDSGAVCGLDISRRMIEIARQRVCEAKIGDAVVLVRGDALHLPFRANAFDGILMSFTLERFEAHEIQFVLFECLHVLRAGGRICVVGLSSKGRRNTMIRMYERLQKKLPRYIDCRPIFVQETLENAGFRILSANNLSLLGLHVECVLAQKTGEQ